MYTFKATITMRHDIASPIQYQQYQLLRKKLNNQILGDICRFCEPVAINPTVSEFFHHPDDYAEQSGTDYLGTTVLIERKVCKFSSLLHLSNYFLSVLPLLSTISPEPWAIAEIEIIEPS